MSQVVVMSNRARLTFQCCCIVKFASGATDNFSGTPSEIIVGDSTFPIIGAPDLGEGGGTFKHVVHIQNFGHVPS